MIVAVGHSEDIDSGDAADSILDQCLAKLGDTVPRAGLLYASIDQEHQVILDRVMDRFPEIHLVGCTTDGELSSEAGFSEDSIVLMLFASDHVEFGSGIGKDLREDTGRAVREAVEAASSGLTKPVRICITNPEGLNINSLDMLAELSKELGDDVPICGGLAGDQERWTGTYQFFGREVLTNSIPVLLFAGPLNVITGIDSGWVPLGPYHHATKVAGNVLYTIDDEPANSVWERYFGSTQHISRHHGFAVFPDASVTETTESLTPVYELENPYKDLNFYMSHPAVFQDDGSMIVLNPIVEGSVLRFSDCTRDQIVHGSSRSIESAVSQIGEQQPDAALVYSCAGRRIVLGTRVVEESNMLKERLEKTPTIGFYTYGELCPLPGSTIPRAHGGTLVTILLTEE